MSPSLLVAVVLAVAPPADAAPLPTAAELAAGLAKVRAAVRDDAHVVWQERFESRSGPRVALGLPTERWAEGFLTDETAQIRLRWEAPPPSAADWWLTDTPAGAPLTGETAADHAGRLICLRAPGDGAVRSQLQSGVLPGPGRFSDRLFTTHDDYEEFGFTVPLYLEGRLWSAGGAGWNAFDHLADSEPATWTVEGRDLKDGRPAVRVFLPFHETRELPSGRGGGGAEFASGLRGWFTDDEGHDLFRVERVGVRRQGSEWVLSGPPTAVSWAEDFRPLPSGVRVPRAGGSTSYATAAVPAFRSLNDATSTGELFALEGPAVERERFAHLEQRWRITTLEPLAPNLEAADLWIEPPDGAQWHDVPTGRERIVGAWAIESWLIFTFRNRYAAWWAFGPPLALCGVFAAAWWWRRRQRRWATA